MNSLNKDEQQYWESYIASLPASERPFNAVVTASFAGNKEITDELLGLYLSGKKSAGSSIVEDFVAAGEPLPQPGNFWIYLNSSGQPCCILRTEKTVIHKFKDIPIEIAVAEGEGDLSLEHWKIVHSELYHPFLKAWGLSDINEATVITEYFKIVFK